MIQGNVFGMTIGEAREAIMQDRQFGTRCPCCERPVKEYKRNLNSGMTLALIHMARVTIRRNVDNGWMHIDDFGAFALNGEKYQCTNLEYSKLRFFGLIESSGEAGERTPSAGCWRVTQTGFRFLRGGRVPKWVRVYLNQKIEESEESVTAREALNVKFDFDELMSS